MKLIIFSLLILNIKTDLIKIKVFDNINLLKNFEEEDITKVYLGNDKFIQEQTKLKKYLEISDKLKFDVSSFDINNQKNENITCCNLFDKNNLFVTKYRYFKNFYINKNKVAFISLTSCKSENNELKAKDLSLIKSLNLVNVNFNPELIIILCNSPSNKILDIANKLENVIVISKFDEKLKSHKKLINENLKDGFKVLNIEIDKKIILSCNYQEEEKEK